MQSREQVERVTQALIDTVSPRVIPEALIPLTVEIMRYLTSGERVTRRKISTLAGTLGDATSLSRPPSDRAVHSTLPSTNHALNMYLCEPESS